MLMAQDLCVSEAHPFDLTVSIPFALYIYILLLEPTSLLPLPSPLENK